MQRVPEPELMTETEQAVAYANADFEEPHNHFVDLLIEHCGDRLGKQGKALDLGCGAADISIRFIKKYPAYMVDGVDGAKAMLAEGKKAITKENLQASINLIESDLRQLKTNNKYDIIFSNSLLHHLHDPMVLWQFIRECSGQPIIFIMDLMRPDSDSRVDEMVETYAVGEPEVLQRDFYNSLKAAFTPEEVELQLKQVGLDWLSVKVVSDRHLIVV